MLLMRALPKALSVAIRTWCPRNETAGQPAALRAIAVAAAQVGGRVEMIVVANRCTDATAEIAHAAVEDGAVGGLVGDRPPLPIFVLQQAPEVLLLADELLALLLDLDLLEPA